MKYYRKLYLGEQISKRHSKTIKKLEKGETIWNTYLIVLSPNVQNQLEIFDSMMLKQEWFQKQDYFVVGLAAGYTEALEVTTRIVDDVYQKTNNAQIRDVLEQWHYMESGAR